MNDRKWVRKMEEVLDHVFEKAWMHKVEIVDEHEFWVKIEGRLILTRRTIKSLESHWREELAEAIRVLMEDKIKHAFSKV